MQQDKWRGGRLVIVFLLTTSLYTQAAGESHASPSNEVHQWLAKMQAAAQQLNYAGTFVYQQGARMRTSRITHLVDGVTEREKLEILDGSPREYIRTGEEVMCYIPEKKTVQVEQKVARDVFPSILTAPPDELAGHYDLRYTGDGRIAGYECKGIVLDPKDNLRYGYRVCAEKSSGLLLHLQTLDERLQVVEQIAFTQLVIGNIDRERVKPSFTDTRGWRTERTVSRHANLASWHVGRLPPGFRKLRQVTRLVSAPNAGGEAGATAREVGQMVFSDGLAAVSVFVEQGGDGRTEGTLQQGALNVLGKRYGDHWVTVVGEVPARAIREIADSIEFRP